MVTAIGGALIAWASYHSQWQSMNDITMYLDKGNFANGMSIFQNISINALLASSKIVLGTLCWLIVPILIFVFSHHYGHFKFRRVVILRKFIRGNSVKGNRIV